MGGGGRSRPRFNKIWVYGSRTMSLKIDACEYWHSSIRDQCPPSTTYTCHLLSVTRNLPPNTAPLTPCVIRCITASKYEHMQEWQWDPCTRHRPGVLAHLLRSRPPSITNLNRVAPHPTSAGVSQPSWAGVPALNPYDPMAIFKSSLLSVYVPEELRRATSKSADSNTWETC